MRYENNNKTILEYLEIGYKCLEIDKKRFQENDINKEEFIKCLDSDLFIIKQQIERMKENENKHN